MKMLRHKQKGAVLITSLIILMILTVLGVGAMGTSSLEEMMAGNLRDQTLAFHAADTGLIGGQNTIQNFGSRPEDDPAGATGVFTSDAFGDFSTLGFDAGTWAQATEYGNIGVKDLPEVSTDPVFIIQEVDFVKSDATIGAGAQGKGKTFYQITSRGIGQSPNSIVLLQMTYAVRYK